MWCPIVLFLFYFWHFWLNADVYKRQGRKVAYVPGTHFYAQGGHDNTLRLNYTMADEAEIEKGMQLLGELFTDGGN